ncbi:MAG: BrnT family toxin [Patescibacteria group bacterium]
MKLNIPKPVAFDWDDGNINKNKISHGVEFAECEQVFLNEPIKILEQVRYVAFGKTDSGRELTIVFELKKDKIRVISARDRNKKEKV